jgi:hypothetical protein
MSRIISLLPQLAPLALHYRFVATLAAMALAATADDIHGAT